MMKHYICISLLIYNPLYLQRGCCRQIKPLNLSQNVEVKQFILMPGRSGHVILVGEKQICEFTPEQDSTQSLQ